jgi:hypothetical protein
VNDINKIKENLIVVFGSEGSGISPVVALEC